MPDPGQNQIPLRVLLVQCCNLPQWIFVWRRLAERHPDWQIEGLALDHPRVHYYVQRMLAGETVHFGTVSEGTPDFQRILFPLLNRGYGRIKQKAWNLAGARFGVDYSGLLEDLSGSDLLRSIWAARHQPTGEFESFLQGFPHVPLGDLTLFVESAARRDLARAEARLDELRHETTEVVRVRDGRLVGNWWRLRRRRFDSAVVFFTGEQGRFGLKLLPFLLGISRILIFNEHASHFNAGLRSLTGFWLQRIRHGIDLRAQCRRVLFIQTEGRAYARAALEKLAEPKLFPDSQILVFCREQDRDALSGVPGVTQCIPYSRGFRISDLWLLWRGIRRFDPQMHCAVFTGRPTFWKQKLLYFALAGRRNFILNARLDGYWLRPTTFRRIFRREPLLLGGPAISEPVLLIQTETPIYTREAALRVRKPELAPHAELSLLCREQDRAAFEDLVPPERLFTYRRGQSLKSVWQLWRRLRARRFTVKAAVFTGHPTFRPGKLLFFLIPAPTRLVFNAGLDAYWLGLRNLPRLFRREPLLFGDKTEITRLVLYQTEVPDYMRAAHARLVRQELYPDARILLFCREADRPHLSSLKGVEIVRSFGGRSLRELLRHWREIRRFKPHLHCAVFTGRAAFRPAKLFALATGFRRLLILNAGLDAYWFRPTTFRRLFRSEPLLYGDKERPAGTQKVLLLETEAIEEMEKAAEILTRPNVVPGARITVFCHQSRSAAFAALPAVTRVLTYGEAPLENLRTVMRLLRERQDVVAGVFSGRRIFVKQKLLFWLVRTRSRLAFNRGLDCRYLGWRDMSVMFNHRGSRPGPALRAARQLVKALLFLPRFAYLLIWAFVAGRTRTRRRTAGYSPGRPGSREA